MKRNALLSIAALFCLATSALAADEKQSTPPQSNQTEQTQMASNDADKPMDHTTNANGGCPAKPGKHSKQKRQRNEPEGEPQAYQSQVEYGGGG